MNIQRHHLTMFLALLLMLSSQAAAQPNLRFNRVGVQWPTVELYFNVACLGTPVWTLSPADFRIFEDGIEVDQFTLHCPDPTARCPMSVALVLDASGSMQGAGIAGEKAAAHAFIDLMDGIGDEVAVLSFNDNVTVHQSMTTDRSMLHAGVDQLAATGATFIWDAIYRGIQEVVNDGGNTCRAVVAVTDGGDGSSWHTPAEVISLANRHDIRVFTIGLGTGINATELELIAKLSGGRYYQTPNAGQLTSYFQEISTIISQGLGECMITFESSCTDGALHVVDMHILNFCGGSDAKSKTFRAPKDSSIFQTVNTALESTSSVGGVLFTVPWKLLQGPPPQWYPFTTTLRFNPDEVDFVNVLTDGTLLENLPVTFTLGQGTVNIQSTNRATLASLGTLLEFRFRAKPSADTVHANIRLEDVTFERGCVLVPDAEAVAIIRPLRSVVTCDFSAPTGVRWDADSACYIPQSFSVVSRYFNTGDEAAVGGRYTISFPQGAMRLVSPQTETIVDAPEGIPAGDWKEVRWELTALPRSIGDSIDICVGVTFDNHPPITCCARIHVPQAGAVLQCSTPPPSIVLDTRYWRYHPMPFVIEANVTNIGGTRSDTVFATLELQGDLRFHAPDSEETRNKRVIPRLLFPQQSGSVLWMLSHPLVKDERVYDLPLYMYAGNADTSFCMVRVVIPGTGRDMFRYPLSHPSRIELCEGDTAVLDGGANVVRWMWSTLDTTRLLVASDTGLYFCVGETADGRLGFSDTIRITFLPRPPRPVIQRVGDVLWTGPASTYVWHLDGDVIPGAVSDSLRLLRPGRYGVIITNEYGCEARSDPFDVAVLGVEQNEGVADNFIIYPHPVRNDFTVRVDVPEGASYHIEVLDHLGRSVYQGHGIARDRSGGITIPFVKQPAGVYHVVLRTPGQCRTRRVIKF